MTFSTHIGFGSFRLEDFSPGDLFARFDSSLARVCDPQPPGRSEHIQVAIDFGTPHATKVWLHVSAQAFAITEEQAWSIEEQRRARLDAQAEQPSRR